MNVFKMIFEKFSKKGIVWQVTIVFSLITVIPSIIITTSYFHVVQDSLLQEAQKNTKQYLTKMDANMTANMETVDYVLNQLNFSQEFSYYLDPLNTLSEREKNHYTSSLQQELLNIRYIYPNRFNRIVIYSKSHQIQEYADWSYYIDRLYDRDYYPEIEQNKNQKFYGNVRMYDNSYGNLVKYEELENEEELVLPVYQKIYNLSTGNNVGLIEIDMSLNRLVNSDSLTNEDSDVTYLLFDRNHKLVFSTDAKHNNDFLSLRFDGDSGACSEKLVDTDYLVAYDKDSVTGLMRVVLMNKKDILASTRGIGNLLIFIAFLSLAIIVIFTNVVAHIMFRRLREMAKMISQIESGQFDMRIKTHGFNEISNIAESFNHMAETLQSVIRSMVEKEKAQKEAELNALQAQINPHFLYNTLEGMRMQCEITENYTLADNIAKLGYLLRYSLNWEKKTVTLEEELNNVKDYIGIMKMRFDRKLVYHVDCDKMLLKVMIPKFILQPLVENCFSHAFVNSLPPWVIQIKVYLSDDQVIIQIEDNGVGIPEEQLTQIQELLNNNQPIPDHKKAKHSIGIINVKQRMELLCLPGSRLTITSNPGSGTIIKIAITLNVKE